MKRKKFHHVHYGSYSLSHGSLGLPDSSSNDDDTTEDPSSPTENSQLKKLLDAKIKHEKFGRKRKSLDSLLAIETFEFTCNGPITFNPRRADWGKYSLSSREEVIFCKCEENLDVGLMVQCEACLTWQHSTCVGFIDEVEIPDRCTCWNCKDTEKRQGSTYCIQTWDATGQFPLLVPEVKVAIPDQE
jgi:hypothetical protein